MTYTRLTLAVVTAALAGCGLKPPGPAANLAEGELAARARQPILALGGQLRLLASVDGDAEAPRPSPDKQVVAFVCEEKKQVPDIIKQILGLAPDATTPRLVAWFTWLDGKLPPGPVVGGTFHNVVEPSFSPDGKQLIYCMQKHLPGFARGEKLEEMRLERRTLDGGRTTVVYDGPLTLLHPMYSPNGKTIVAYARNIKGQEGLYTLDATREGAQPVRITQGEDKHPVWSSDGKRIFFHAQKGGNAGEGDAENAWIGMVDMSDARRPRRVMLDDPGKPLYHKHPTPLPGSDLLVYHASDGDNTWLEAMSIGKRQSVRLQLEGVSPHGLKLEKFKHPQFSPDGKELVLVARASKKAAEARGVKEYYRVYMLPNAKQLVQGFKRVVS